MSSREALNQSNRSGQGSDFALDLARRAHGLGTMRGGGAANVKNARAYYIGKDWNGTPMYRVSYLFGNGKSRINVTVAYDANAKRVSKPKLSGQTGGINAPGDNLRVAGSTGAAAALQRSKDNWASWVTQNQFLGPQAQAGLLRQIREWDGSAADLNKHMRFIEANVPVSAPGVASWEFDDFPDIPGGGGGGGGGFAGPVYEAPDRRVVEDYVRGVSVSLLGGIPDEGYIQKFTDLYMKDHRRDFDTPDRVIDPAQSVVEAFRQTAEYQTIHKLRPESEDERGWVAARRQMAEAGGLNQELQEGFAVNQATIAGDLEDTRRAASMQQIQTTGKAPTLLENQFRDVANAMFSQVRK